MTGTMAELTNLGVLKNHTFFSGVPDSLLAVFIDAIKDRKEAQHVPAVNEAHAIAIAFGAMLAGEDACVYLQNSGLGNIINPITSLCMPAQIYPFLIIGHRHTLEQHLIMGELDEKIMALLGYPQDRYFLVHGDNNEK